MDALTAEDIQRLKDLAKREEWRDVNDAMMKRRSSTECNPWCSIVVFIATIVILGAFAGGFGYVRGHWDYFFSPST